MAYALMWSFSHASHKSGLDSLSPIVVDMVTSGPQCGVCAVCVVYMWCVCMHTRAWCVVYVHSVCVCGVCPCGVCASGVCGVPVVCGVSVWCVCACVLCAVCTCDTCM